MSPKKDKRHPNEFRQDYYKKKNIYIYFQSVCDRWESREAVSRGGELGRLRQAYDWSLDDGWRSLCHPAFEGMITSGEHAAPSSNHNTTHNVVCETRARQYFYHAGCRLIYFIGFAHAPHSCACGVCTFDWLCWKSFLSQAILEFLEGCYDCETVEMSHRGLRTKWWLIPRCELAIKKKRMSCQGLNWGYTDFWRCSHHPCVAPSLDPGSFVQLKRKTFP